MASNKKNTRSGSQRSAAQSRRELARKKKARKRRRIILFTVEIMVLLVLLVVLYGVMTLGKTQRIKVDEEEIAKNFNNTVQENEAMKGYRNIALFGVDSRKGKLGKGERTDTIMIASINQDTGEVKLCSIYRDTYLNLGNDSYNKCNSSYAKGGPELALTMLNSNLDMNITDFVTVGFDALIETIDLLGGVEIDVHENEISHLNNYQMSMFSVDENTPLNENIVKVTQPGMQTLSGLQATAYCRIRAVGNDFGRAERQRKVLMACMEKAKQVSPAKLVEILQTVMGNVATSLSVDEMAEVLSEVTKYSIVANDGFPFEETRTTATIGQKGSCVIPVDLETNVVKLHEFFFGQEEYTPSEEVKTISAKIQADTASYIRS